MSAAPSTSSGSTSVPAPDAGASLPGTVSAGVARGRSCHASIDATKTAAAMPAAIQRARAEREA